MVKHIKNLVFDLDDTLYPSSKNIDILFKDKAAEYLEKEKGMTKDEVFDFFEMFREKGSLLKDVDLGFSIVDFFEYTCDVDVSSLDFDERLKNKLSKLPHKKIIYTNSTHKHTNDVLDILDIKNHFHHIFAVENADYDLKPEIESFTKFINKTGVNPRETAMFEDNLFNLKTAKELGMITVFISEKNLEKPDFCDYVFKDVKDALRMFL